MPTLLTLFRPVGGGGTFQALPNFTVDNFKTVQAMTISLIIYI